MICKEGLMLLINSPVHPVRNAVVFSSASEVLAKGELDDATRSNYNQPGFRGHPVSMTLTRNGSAAAANQEIEISAAVGLHNVIAVKL